MAIPFLDMHIHHWQFLVDRLAQGGVPVKAAFWSLESESDEWYLYLVTPLVKKNGSRVPAYSQVNVVIRKIRDEGIWTALLDHKVIGPHDPIARDVLASQDRYPTRNPK